MKTRLILWIALGLLAGLLVACSLVGSKGDVIKCTGTQYYVSDTGGEVDWVDGNQHMVGGIIKFDQLSDCPELNGHWTVTGNAYFDYAYSGPAWGTFYFESSYGDGGVIEGIWHGVQNADSSIEVTSDSYNATGSLHGLRMSLTVKYAGDPSVNDGKFEATIQNAPNE
jgi:hypothetical protein